MSTERAELANAIFEAVRPFLGAVVSHHECRAAIFSTLQPVQAHGGEELRHSIIVGLRNWSINNDYVVTAAMRDEMADAILARLSPAPESRKEDGARPLPIARDTLGRMVREAWVRWAETQPNPKPSWLLPYDELAEPDKEADRQIGETVARWTLIHDAASSSPAFDSREEDVAPLHVPLPCGAARQDVAPAGQEEEG